MWNLQPDEQLRMIERMQAGLRSDVASTKAAELGHSASLDRFRGLHLRVGRTLIVIGRTPREEDARHPDPAHL
jgi:hypothetical protein